MLTKNFCYLNGEILRYQDCNLHISDLLIQRGYGIFDFFRCRKGNMLWLEDYTERLFQSIHLSGIETELNRKEFTSIIHNLQAKNGDLNGAFKVIVSGGNSENLASVTGGANVIILNVPWNSPPPESIDKGVKLISCTYRRPDPKIKSLFYFNLLKLQKELKKANAIDVLYHTDTISETSRANVFFVKGKRIYTPSKHILHGVVRKQVLSLADVQLEEIEIARMWDFDEAFISSTSRDITPVVSVDGKVIGNGHPGKVTRDLQAVFRERGWF